MNFGGLKGIPAIGALIAALAMAAVACHATVPAGEPTLTPVSRPPPISGEASFVITEGDREQVVAHDFAEVQARLPFAMIAPVVYPDGMELKRAFALMPILEVSGEVAHRHISVHLVFSGEEGAGAFMLQQRIFEEGMNPPQLSGAQDIAVGDGTGQIRVDRQRDILLLAWTGCGVSFILGAPESNLDQETALW